MTPLARSNLRPCPICGDLERQVLHRQRFLKGALGDGYEVVVCRGCGGGFADSIPAQIVMDRYYTEQSKYAHADAGGSESPWDLKRFEMTVEQVTPHLGSREAAILDIGCATGGLLGVFKGRGYRRMIGADPSAACATAARRLHGVEVRVATLGQLDAWPERYDLVLMLGVLEHLREVRPAIHAAARLLAPGGLLYCAVPDVEGLATCANAPFQQFSVEHVNFFSADSLARAMACCGLAVKGTWHWTTEWREGIMEPIVSGLYAPAEATLPVDFDDVTEPALRRYLAASAAGDIGIIRRIDEVRLSQEPFLVWGAGTLTRRLLAETRLMEANIAAFVDSNPNLHGQQLAGRLIMAPADLVGRPEAILISSQVFEKEITAIIRNTLKLPNRIVSLTGASR